MNKSSYIFEEAQYSLLHAYFGEYQISQSLIDLVLPKKEYYLNGGIFSKHSACLNQSKNCRYIDALANCIDNSCKIRNPSNIAIGETDKYGIPHTNIFSLSLGTGDYARCDVKRHFLTDTNSRYFNVAFEMPLLLEASRNDNRMFNRHGPSNYYRWQRCLEKPIGFYDFRWESVQILVENARQYIEELDCSDENSINKLVEALL